MNWWEEAEARARRAKSPASAALGFWQRLQAAGLNPDVAQAAAYDLGLLQSLAADLVLLTEGLLLAADGDAAAMKRQALALTRWAEMASAWAERSGALFNQLLDTLDLEPETLAAREEVGEAAVESLPEEEAKLNGRYRNWHLLYERLDLKLASAGLEEHLHRNLARCLARLYEEALVTIRLLAGLEKDATPRFRGVARLLLELNTTWHFDLGPNWLGHGRLRGGEPGALGLQTWLLLAFGRNP